MGPESVEPHLFRCKESPWSFLKDLLQHVHVTMVNSRLKFTPYNKNDDSTRIAGSCLPLAVPQMSHKATPEVENAAKFLVKDAMLREESKSKLLITASHHY